MAAGCEEALGSDAVSGLVIVPAGSGGAPASIRVRQASHPTPDHRAVEATRQLCDLLASTTQAPILCLISGGASSLLVRPRDGVSLPDKQRTTELLLASGATIQQMNMVRKHLSEVKGGGLLRRVAPRPVVSLILSDVVGDDVSVIGSGPTAADPSTFSDALDVLECLALVDRVPVAVRRLLERGARGQESETLKVGDPGLAGVTNLLVGTNRTAVHGAAAAARRLGYRTYVIEEPLAGDTTERAHAWTATVLETMQSCAPGPTCIIAGGETTVTVRGNGRGGRNQEFALAALEGLAGRPVAILSAGTDGIDGPTPAAGAFVDGDSQARALDGGLDPMKSLRDNDSYTFFAALGDLFAPGATGTNVMDVKIALSLDSAPGGPVLQE